MKSSSLTPRRLLGAVFLSACLFSPGLASWASAAAPVGVDLGSLGGNNTSAYFLNNSGQIVGEASLPGEVDRRLILWSASAGLQALPVFGMGYNQAVAFNDAGQIAGSYLSAIVPGDNYSYKFRVFVWTTTLGFRDIGMPEVNYASVMAMNQAGQIAGTANTNQGYKAFVWDPVSGYRDLGSLGGYYTSASAMNNRGQIVGSSQNANNGTDGFIWDTASGMQQLIVPDLSNVSPRVISDTGYVWGTGNDVNTNALMYFVWDAAHGARIFPSPDTGPFANFSQLNFRGVSPSGVVVADSGSPFTGFHAFAGDPVSGFRMLTMPGVAPAFDYSNSESIRGVNQAGQATGYASTTTGATHAFFFDPVNGMTDLGVLPGDDQSIAHGINDHAQVVGVSSDSLGNNRAFVWDAAGGLQPIAGAATGEADYIPSALISNAGAAANIQFFDQTSKTVFAPLSATTGDAVAPVITSLSASPSSIWPANKKMVAVKITAVATDNVAVTSLKIISVTTNEPDNKTQWQITGALKLNVLADRNGNGTGRIYTIAVEAADAAGNKSTKNVTVSVPHDQGK